MIYMDVIADLHLHSKHARGCSPRMGILQIAAQAKLKGINLLGTGDFTHPKYFEEIKKECKKCGEMSRKEIDRMSAGMEKVGGKNSDAADANCDGLLFCNGIFFVPTSEINNTFESADGKKRRVHNLVVMPDLELAAQFNDAISKKSKLGVDGRPWVKMNLGETVEILQSVSAKSLFIPAHAWTPWYGIFGAKGGFGSLKDAFEGQEKHVYAIETGLSSDPAMNWRCSWLDSLQLVSFSDAHSPEKLGREATVLEVGKLSYDELFSSVACKEKRKLKKTIEFFPQEGKYYSDGCRKCEVRSTPAQTKEFGGRCPKCGRKITKGVLGRIDELADREGGIVPKNAAAYDSIVPLRELAAMAIEKGVASDAAKTVYCRLIEKFGNEFDVLLNADAKEISNMDGIRSDYAKAVSGAILRMREGKLNIEPGYDGKFGVVGL